MVCDYKGLSQVRKYTALNAGIATAAGDMVIDWKRVEDLRLEIGPDDFDEIVCMFLDEADEVVCRLGDLPDAASLERDLHFLKGSALNLGFTALAQICQSGEREAAAGRTDIPTDAVAGIYAESCLAFLGGFKTAAA